MRVFKMEGRKMSNLIIPKNYSSPLDYMESQRVHLQEKQTGESGTAKRKEAERDRQ